MSAEQRIQEGVAGGFAWLDDEAFVYLLGMRTAALRADGSRSLAGLLDECARRLQGKGRRCGEGPDTASACPDCGAPGRFCVCVLRTRMKGAERERDRVASERGAYLQLWQFSASCLRYNADRLRKPRGKDEERIVAWAVAMDATHLGMAWSGTTGGWLEWLEKGG